MNYVKALCLSVILLTGLSFADEFIYVDEGDMGVGNPNPQAKLDVAGNIIVSGGKVDIGGTIYQSTGFGQSSLFETDYSGDYDMFSSPDDDANFSGAQTWALEVKMSPVTGDSQNILMNQGRNGATINDGFRFWQATDESPLGYCVHVMKASGGGANVLTYIEASGSSYDKLVMVFDGVDTTKLYVNGVLGGTLVESILLGSGNLSIGAFMAQVPPVYNSHLRGHVRNIEIYSGEASNPTAWVPGDTESLSGVSLKFQSVNGSGTDNEQGMTFNKHGNPQVYSVRPMFAFDESTGFVGIGTDESSFPLQVIGDVSATAFLVSSDERLKRDIQPLTGSLNKLNLFGGKSYEKRISDAIANTTDGGTAKIAYESEIGFIAQEIEAAFPECVKEDQRGIKYVNYTALVPVLCEALKEVDAKHQLQLKALEEKYQANTRSLEARLRALEARQ